MSALRKAGVWLGLVEEEDDRVDSGYDDEFDEEDFTPAPRPRSLARPGSRAERLDRNGRLDRVDRSDRADRADRSDRSDRADRLDRGTDYRAEYRGVERTVDREAELRAVHDVPPSREPYREAVRDSARDAGRDDGRDTARAGSVRQLSRPGPSPATAARQVSFPTQDNLALAPQVQLHERAVVSDDKNRRMHITTLHPTTFNEARAIGEHFRDGYPVIMNLTEMDEADARRLVDFAAGLAFGLRGSMDRVTNRVFLLSPENVQVSAEDKARIAEGGFFDQG